MEGRRQTDVISKYFKFMPNLNSKNQKCIIVQFLTNSGNKVACKFGSFMHNFLKLQFFVKLHIWKVEVKFQNLRHLIL